MSPTGRASFGSRKPHRSSGTAVKQINVGIQELSLYVARQSERLRRVIEHVRERERVRESQYIPGPRPCRCMWNRGFRAPPRAAGRLRGTLSEQLISLSLMHVSILNVHLLGWTAPADLNLHEQIYMERSGART